MNAVGGSTVVANSTGWEARLFHTLAEALSGATDRRSLAVETAQVCASSLGVLCAIHLLDTDGTLTLTGSAPVTAEILRDEPVRVTAPALYRAHKAAAGRSMIAAPIVVEGSWAGTITLLQAEHSTPFEARDLELLAAIAALLRLALENAVLRDRERQIAESSRFLARATDLLLSTLDHAEMLRLLLDIICEQFADLAVACSSADGVVQSVVARSPGDDEHEHLATGVRLFTEQAEVDVVTAIRRLRPMLVRDPFQTAESLAPQIRARFMPRSFMMVPLTVGGQEYAAIVCFSKNRQYDQTTLEILQELCRRAVMALEAADTLARERRLTQTLQQATLPSHLADLPGATVSTVYLPAAREESVGGDWYDAFALDDHRVLVTVGDVTGHGLNASVIMGKLRHAINVIAMYEPDPSRILDVAERIILRRYPEAVATAFVLVVNSAKKSVLYANAGHPRPFLRFGDGSVRQLPAEGLPIGLRYSSPSAPSVSADLSGVELIALYTDGLTELTRNVIEGERRLSAAVSDEAIVLVHSAADFIKTRCLTEAAPDDIAILAVNFTEAHRWAFDSSDQESGQRSRRDFAQKLRARIDGDAVAMAEIIFGELLANVALYAPGPVDVALRWDNDVPTLHVIDRGPGYTSSARELSDPFEEHGRGLWLISALGGKLQVERISEFGTHTRVALPTTAAV